MLASSPPLVLPQSKSAQDCVRRVFLEMDTVETTVRDASLPLPQSGQFEFRRPESRPKHLTCGVRAQTRKNWVDRAGVQP